MAAYSGQGQSRRCFPLALTHDEQSVAVIRLTGRWNASTASMAARRRPSSLCDPPLTFHSARIAFRAAVSLSSVAITMSP